MVDLAPEFETTDAVNNGQKVMAASSPVVIASDQSAIPISAASLPLPAGAATAANQATEIASLASIDAGIPAALGQTVMASSMPVVIASNQSAVPISAASLPLPTGAATETTLGTRLAEATFTARINTLGQKIMDASTPVTIASDQSTLPISAASLPLPAGAATAANQATEIASLASIDAGIPAALGQTTMSASMPVTIASNQSALPVSQSGSWAVSVNNAAGAGAVNIQDGGNSITVDGIVTVTPGDGTKATYAASASGIVPAAATTDVFTITGSATKTIRITAITISCTTTAGSGFSANLTMVRRSTANTGGTSTTITAGSHDTNNAAATAVVRSYTANPSALGTANGVIRAHRFSISTAGGAGNIGPLNLWEFGSRPAQAIVLRGTSDMLAINLGGVTITSPILSASVEWTEE